VLMPTITFGVLYAWPFLEARLTGDRAEHHLLDRPRDHPVRTGIGAMALTFYALLLLAGSNDIVAKIFLVPVNGVTWAFRILVVTLPLLIGSLMYLWMAALLRSGEDTALHVPLREFRLWRPRPRVVEGDGPVGVVPAAVPPTTAPVAGTEPEFDERELFP
jgi:ubiquinol-cytochrome c reductase cytochrome b subunit